MRPNSFVILVVDDDPNDQFLIQRAFHLNGVTTPIHYVTTGSQAVAYLEGKGPYGNRARFPYPSFIMTDLHMGYGDGISVLEYLKRHPHWKIIPTVIFSASASGEDVRRSYLTGADAYIVKPTDFGELRRRLGLLYDFWLMCEVPTVHLGGPWHELETTAGTNQQMRSAG